MKGSRAWPRLHSRLVKPSHHAETSVRSSTRPLGGEGICGNAQDFVTQTARALKDLALRSTLETNGRASAESRLSWKKLGADLSDAYTKSIPQRERTSKAHINAQPQLV